MHKGKFLWHRQTCPSPSQVDAFTHDAFGGNSAAVVLLEKVHLPLSDSVRQAIAMEMNLSETAFLEVVDDGEAPTGTNHPRFFQRLAGNRADPLHC